MDVKPCMPIPLQASHNAPELLTEIHTMRYDDNDESDNGLTSNKEKQFNDFARPDEKDRNARTPIQHRKAVPGPNGQPQADGERACSSEDDASSGQAADWHHTESRYPHSGNSVDWNTAPEFNDLQNGRHHIEDESDEDSDGNKLHHKRDQFRSRRGGAPEER